MFMPGDGNSTLNARKSALEDGQSGLRESILTLWDGKLALEE
jgi:hypothetical protein